MAVVSPGERLISAVDAVDWKGNIASFDSQDELKEQVASANHSLAIWSKQLETAEKNNAALTFIREAQIQGHYAAGLIALALYKPAASAMRTMFESVLYYSYFNTHTVELHTLIRDPEYYITKNDILQFHKTHTPDFNPKQDSLGLLTRINTWYTNLSAIIHGQKPGAWTTHKHLREIAFVEEVCIEVAVAFEHGAKLIHHLLLCTIDINLWYQFGLEPKRLLLKGLKPEARRALRLTSI